MLLVSDFLALVDKNTVKGEKISVADLLRLIQEDLGREDIAKKGEDGEPERDKNKRVIMIKGRFRYSETELKSKFSQTMSSLKAGTAAIDNADGVRVGKKSQLNLATMISDRVILGKKGRKSGKLAPSLFGGFEVD